ncbi:hypothetical protein RHSIM_Rhsim11G0064600 [Rhododendron simsii]|uniref:Uncharacterized protein n=1 Tax=Rhododendron simsii TaxID=118357 RepID=A0A834G917_RHOSS|nr:hypothetical protein RHSIM_Rhsim11G0064600 [Rhododendron simsii]
MDSNLNLSLGLMEYSQEYSPDYRDDMLESPEREKLLSHEKEHKVISETSLHSCVTGPIEISNSFDFDSVGEIPDRIAPRYELPEMKHKAELLRKRVMDCRRRKDLLHLLLSYPMKPEADQPDFLLLSKNFTSINQVCERLDKIVELSMTPSTYLHERLESVAKDVDDFEYCLDKYGFHMNLYHASLRLLSTSGLKEALASVCEAEERRRWIIDSAVRQIACCIKGGNLSAIGISCYAGIANAGILTKALEDLPEIKSMFGAIIRATVLPCHNVREVQTSIAQEIHRLVGTDLSLPFKRYKFLLFLHSSNEKIDLRDFKIPEDGFVVLTAPGSNVYQTMPVDLEIKMEDHLLPWKLFWVNVQYFDSFREIALQLIEACHGHLLAIVLLARALKSVTDLVVWNLALEELTSSSELPSPMEDTSENVMVRVLKFVWEHKSTVIRHCIRNCASVMTKGGKHSMSSLVSSWIRNDLIETEEEGEHVLRDLMDSFLLEEVGYNYTRMRGETRDILFKHFIPHLYPLHVWKEGLGLSEAPEVAEWDAKVIKLNNNELSELPERPNCAVLVKLFLQNNNDLMEIPQLFFDCMPKLQFLDLSYTSIKSLPPYISRLVSLQEFLLRGCELLMELPPEIGELSNLQVFDLEGTEIINLPCEIGKLTKLECLKVSFYGYGNSFGKSKRIKKRIPMGFLTRLESLKELSIDVDPDDEEWLADVADFILELQELRGLVTLKLYLPEIVLLEAIKYVPNCKITAGLHKQRVISCLPHAVQEEFEKQKNYLKYANGKYVPTEIQNTLKRTGAFFLDRHWTVKKLSEFGTENMVDLKFCLLVECNELQTIIDGREPCEDREHYCDYGVVKRPVLESLEYLGVYRMMNLRSVWQGPIQKGVLAKLKSLALHICPNLTTIFTTSLLANLMNLEELTIEDCPKINSLVTRQSSSFESSLFLPRLKKILLLDLPELGSIASGLFIAPMLEKIIIYDCPMLVTLSPTEFSSSNLKMIKGEIEWWEALTWPESKWSSERKDLMASVFVELKRDASLMDQLADNGISP